MTALDDQHVAGLIMALEQSIVMGIALAWLFARMLAESEEEERRRERWGSDPFRLRPAPGRHERARYLRGSDPCAARSARRRC